MTTAPSFCSSRIEVSFSTSSPNIKDPHLGLASLITRAPEHDCRGPHHQRQDQPCRRAHRLQLQGSACGCALIYRNIDHHRITIEQKARPVGHPGGWSARDVRQGVANCVLHLFAGLEQTLVHCEKTIHVRGRTMLAKRPSHRLQPVKCEFATRH